MVNKYNKMRKIIKVSFITVCLFITSLTFSQNRIDAGFKQVVSEASDKLWVSQPDMSDPVTVNAELVWSNNREQLAVVMKVRVLENWHIYAYVPGSQPYITTELKLSVPDGVTPVDKWEKPGAYPSADGVYIYEGSLVFVHYFSVDKPVKEKQIETGLYYQTCDLKQCLPPQIKMRKLTL